jgi:hypothetical protein
LEGVAHHFQYPITPILQAAKISNLIRRKKVSPLKRNARKGGNIEIANSRDKDFAVDHRVPNVITAEAE